MAVPKKKKSKIKNQKSFLRLMVGAKVLVRGRGLKKGFISLGVRHIY
jgi:hypothetical protein